MRIEIMRPVRLTVWGTEIQAFKPGEIYDVAPAIGSVLVKDGWAMQLAIERRELWGSVTDDTPETTAAMSGS